MSIKKPPSPRYQFLISALCISILTAILSLSAYLTDITETFSAPITMMYGNEFGVDIKSTNYTADQTIVPGGTAIFDPYLENNGNYDTYVFMEIVLPDQTFYLDELSSKWTRLTSVTNKVIYAYGSSTALTRLSRLTRQDDKTFKGGETAPLCTGVTLEVETDLNESTYTIQAKGYAIQADNIGSSEPNVVWGLISSSLSSTTNG